MLHKISLVPSLFTMLNLFFGFFAIVNALQEKFVTAAWLIIIAAVWDGIDGKIARKANASSEFGVEFDSLADVVSFGVSPAVLIYQVYFYKLGAPGVILSFLPLLFGSIRLARFNVNLEASEKENFSGLPIPSMAVTISAYVIFNYDLWEGLRFAPVFASLVVLLSILMVSNVEYETIPKLTFRGGRKNSLALTVLVLALGCIVVFREKAMFPLVLGFVLLGVFRSILNHVREEDEDEEVFDISLPD